MQSTFFAIVSRMKYIERWALMRSSRPENLSEHSLEVAMIAHALATIGNVRYGRQLDASEAALKDNSINMLRDPNIDYEKIELPKRNSWNSSG